MNKHIGVAIAAAALTIGVGTSAGVSGYMIGHHNGAATHTAEWRIEPSDIERAVGEYLHQQQWEATKRQAQDISWSDDLLTPHRVKAAPAVHRDLTKQEPVKGTLDWSGGYH